MAYKKYDPMIKKMIIETRNPNLFPEYNIPRSTSLYWINQSKEISSNFVKLKEYDEFHSFKKGIFKLKAEKELLQKILSKTLELSSFQSLLGIKKKEYIVKLIDEISGVLSIVESSKVIGITPSQYYRWRSEVYGCLRSGRKCDSTRPNQLTRIEQERLVKLALDKKYSHMSVKSLMYYSQREGLLYCGYESWLKYLKLNKVVRHRFVKRKKKKYRKGIRAKKPCEIWHIDITEVKILNEEKFYIQMIVDNFSRAIVSWKISKKKNMELSIKTIKDSIRNEMKPIYLMSDGGGENVNSGIRMLLWGKGITHMIAQSDMIFSNSMIEAVFRKLKSVINFERINTYNGLSRKIHWFVRQYNNHVPHSQLKGASPKEQLEMSFDQNDFDLTVRKERLRLIGERSADFQRCRSCF